MPLVECHSGHTYAERPTVVWWEGERLEVEAVEQEWQMPEGKRFWVRTKGGRAFELNYIAAEAEWNVKMING
jgi:hypothetical protein